MPEHQAERKSAPRRRKKSLSAAAVRHFREILEKMPVPAYVCDADGLLVFYNRYAAELWGREAALGDSAERFCGALKLYDRDGGPVPHDRSWMALALAEKRPFDGREIVIARPDGERRTVLAHANPIFQSDTVAGAVNVLIDITAQKSAQRAQARLAAIVESSDDAIISKSLEGRIESWNDGATAHFGYSAAEAVGQPILMLIPPERRTEEERILATIRAGKHISNFETVRIAKSGRRVDVSITISPVRDAGGRVIGASTVARDISARKLLEEERERANAMLSTLVEASPLPILVIDVEPPIVRLWNPASEKLFGWKASEILGKPLPIVPKEKQEEYARFRERVVRGEDVRNIETTRRSKSGTLIEGSLSAAPLYENGNVVGIMGTFADMTGRKKVENALKNANRMKDEFLATLAHELRNPLAPLRNAIEILQLQGVPTPESQWALDIMGRQMRQMTRLIDDLMDIARITGNKLEIRKEKIALADVLRVAVETSKPLIESSGQTFSVSIPEEPIYIKGDQVRLAQAVSNLLNNAAKYTEPGGRIWLYVERKGTQVAITVRDTGVGISAEMLPYVFDMFRQADRASGGKGGLGIGLTLAKRLVKMHGGSIHVESKGVSKGSSFVIYLPSIVEGETSSPAPAAPKPASGNLRVLIVDDNEDAVSTLHLMLSLAGHRIRTARDGIEAVDIANTYRPNVVLLDIGMPRMNGYEAAATIRKQSWGENMVLIAMTGWGQVGDREKSKAAGFDEHLVKPVDPQALLLMLKRIEENRPAAINR